MGVEVGGSDGKSAKNDFSGLLHLGIWTTPWRYIYIQKALGEEKR